MAPDKPGPPHADPTVSPRQPLRLGVIGAGWFASRRHCPDIVAHPQARLTALCRRSRPELERMGQAFGVRALFTDHRELLASGLVDAVVVCSPHDLHYEHARAALAAGLPVLLEKPLTLDPAQGRELVALAARRGLVLLVAQNPPYWSHCRYLRAAVAGGRLGDLEAVSITWAGNALGVLGREPLPASLPGVVPPTLFRADAAANGGFLTDGGSHLICELVWCTGRRVVEVSSLMDDPANDLRAIVAMRLDNGATATLSNTADSRLRGKRHYSLYCGSAGTAVIRGVPFAITLEAGGATESCREDELPAPPTPVADFVDAVHGRGGPQIDGDTAVHVVEVLDAAYRSARERKAVSIGPG